MTPTLRTPAMTSITRLPRPASGPYFLGRPARVWHAALGRPHHPRAAARPRAA